MKVFIVQFPFGILAFDEENKLIEKTLFSKKPQVAAKTLLRIESEKISENVITLVNQVKDAGYDTLVFDNGNLASEAQRKLDVKVEVSEAGQFRSQTEQLAVETGFANDTEEASRWTRNVSMELAKLRVKGAVEQRDLVVAQAIQTLDDMDRTVNLFMGRLREWYGVHFPELDRLIEKHETYARLVLNLGSREGFTLVALEKEEIPKTKAEAAAEMADTSMGADITEADLVEVKALSKTVLDMYE